MQKYQSIISGTNGSVIRNVPVTVLKEGGSLAEIFLDREGQVPAPNPLVTDSRGVFYFYAKNGRYSLRTAADGVQITDADTVLLFDPDETVADGPIADAVRRAEDAAERAETALEDSGLQNLVQDAQDAAANAAQAVIDANQAVASIDAALIEAGEAKDAAQAAAQTASNAASGAQAVKDSLLTYSGTLSATPEWSAVPAHEDLGLDAQTQAALNRVEKLKDDQQLLKQRADKSVLSYPDYAAASAAAATLPGGQTVYDLTDGFAYTVSSGVLGQKRPAFSFPALPTLNEITAAMREGKVVKVACYGDSTTDGNRTSGWTANPVAGGVPVGNTDHESTAPKAWPAQLKAILRLMFKNNNIQVWNAGYSGQRLDNGWALNNYDKAVTSNPAYGVPDICFIGFGLNDITASDVYQNHYKNTYELCVKLIASGTLPVLLTCDAIQLNDPAARDSEEATQVVDSAKMAVARQLNIPILEVGAAMRQWASCNSSGYTWAGLQPDDLHFGDAGHAFKAGFVAANLYPDLIKPFDSMEVVAQDPRWQLNSSKTWTKHLTSNPKSGRNYFTAAGSGDELMSGWVWNTHPDMRLVFLEVDGGGSASQPQRGSYTVLDTVSGIVNTVTSTDNSARVDTLRVSDIPISVGVLPVGLSRISSSVKVGAAGQNSYSCDLLFRKMSTNPPSIVNMRLPSSVGYKLTGHDPSAPFAFFAPERYYCDLPSNAPKLLTITARMEQSGIILWHSKGFSDTDRSYRAGLSIYLSPSVLYLTRASGSPTASADYFYNPIATCPLSSVVLDSDGYLSITVELDFVSGVPNIKIKQGSTTLIDASCAGRALPFTGHIGGLIHREDGVKPVIKEMNWQEL